MIAPVLFIIYSMYGKYAVNQQKNPGAYDETKKTKTRFNTNNFLTAQLIFLCSTIVSHQFIKNC